VEIGRKSSREPSGACLGDGLAWGVTLSQKFDFTGRNALRKAIAQSQLERAESGLAQFRRELAAKTAALAHALLAAQQRLEASEEVAARGRALLETLLQRDPAGIAALLETRVVEADILKLSKTAAVQRAELLSALAGLNLLRGLPPASPLVLDNLPPAFAEPPPDEILLATAFRENFALRQFRLELREQGLALSLEEKNTWGELTLSPYYSEERAGGLDRAFGVGLSVPLPLWNANRVPVLGARSRLGQAENALLKARRDLHRDLVSAALNYRARLRLLAGSGPEKAAQFRDAAELADRHYRLGAIPVSTCLALQQAYLDALETLLATRVEAVQAAAQLTALTGLPVETFLKKTEGAAR
jgi:cobalt-zinc-cadmium efflux system outer membrane protein